MVAKKIRFVFPVFAFLSLLAGVSSGGDRVGDFALIDHDGSFQHMSWYNDQNAIVIMAYSPGSSDSDTLTALKDLERQYSEQKTTFFLINPGLQTDRARISSDLSEQNLDFAVLMDDAQLVSEMLGLTRLGEAVVYDPSSFEISYRGGIESLEAAVKRTLNSETSEFLTTAAAGEPIQYS
ncbi:MAG: hypothetical protein P8P42_10215, partial [Gammaproteobacteria bacterium]|nr:hypothetical protein [Gammaproteobacteria bacterium]